jgi:hypothetical protein
MGKHRNELESCDMICLGKTIDNSIDSAMPLNCKQTHAKDAEAKLPSCQTLCLGKKETLKKKEQSTQVRTWTDGSTPPHLAKLYPLPPAPPGRGSVLPAASRRYSS